VAKPSELHAAAQAPETHCWPVAQAWPHDPQFFASTFSFTQVELQVLGSAGGQVHAPAWQYWPPPHAVPAAVPVQFPEAPQ